MTVVPAELDEQIQKRWIEQVLDIVEQTWATQNPTMYEWCEQIWFRYMVVTYPFLPEGSAQQWATALYTYVEQCETGKRYGQIRSLPNFMKRKIVALC